MFVTSFEVRRRVMERTEGPRVGSNSLKESVQMCEIDLGSKKVETHSF